MSEVADLYVTLRARTDQFVAGMRRASTEGEASAAKINAATQRIAKYSTVAILGTGIAAVKQAADFQDAMLRVKNLAMGGHGNLQALSNQVLDLAGKVGYGPTSLSDALYHIESNFYSVGMGGKQAFHALQVAAEGARIGNADLVDVTNALGAAVASGIPGVQSYDKAMGMLLATVGSGDMQMQDLANAFSTGLLAIAKQYGATMNDIGSALATFGDNNIRGQVAATDLRMAIMDLTHQAKPGVTALQNIGIASGQLARDMQTGGLSKAMDDLHRHLVANGIEGVKTGEFLEEAFTKKSSAPLAILMDQLDRFHSKQDVLNKGANQFGHDWGQLTQTLKQKWADFSAQFQVDLIKIGDRLIPLATQALSGFQTAFSWIGNHIDTITSLSEVLLGAAAGFYALKVATMAWAAIQWITNVIQGAAAFVSLATEIRSVSEAQALLSMAMTSTPWGAVAALVGGAITAFAVFGHSSDDAKQAAERQQQKIDALRFSYDKLNGSINATSLTEVKTQLDKTGAGALATKLGIQPRLLPLALSGDTQAVKALDAALAKLSRNTKTLDTLDDGSVITYADEAKVLTSTLNTLRSGTLAPLANTFRENQTQANFAAGAFAKVHHASDLMNLPLIANQQQLLQLAQKWHWSADEVRTVVAGELVPVTKQGVQQVIDALNGLGPLAKTSMTNAGNDMKAGLTGGFFGVIGAVADIAVQAGQAAEAALRKQTQTHSPSRVFHAVGVDMAQGLIDGMASLQPSIEKTASDLGYNAYLHSQHYKRQKGVHHDKHYLTGVLPAHHKVVKAMEDRLDRDIHALSHRRTTIAAYAAHDKTASGRAHAISMVDQLLNQEKKLYSAAARQRNAIYGDKFATAGSKHRAEHQLEHLNHQIKLANALHAKLVDEQIKAHKAAAAAHARRESARKALRGDIPTYLEAATAAGYTSTGRGLGTAVAAGAVVHETTIVLKVDSKELSRTVQRQVLQKERRNTSNGLSRRRSAKQ